MLGAVKLLRRCPSLSTLVSEFLCTNAYLFRCTSKAPSKVCSGVRITPPRCTPAASRVPKVLSLLGSGAESCTDR